jgi:hypothetical protein
MDITNLQHYTRKYKDKIFEPYEEEYCIRGIERDSEQYFSGAVRIVLDKFKLKSFELANEFKVSENTCIRWKSGKSFPLKSIRGVILNRLEDLVVESQRIRDK